MQALLYIPAVVGFAAALIAIGGAPKWDPTQHGLRRLTATGRVALAMAAIALLASSVLTWRAQQSADFQRIQRERITTVAHTELRLAIRQLSGPFFEVLFRETGQVPPEFGLVPLNVLDQPNRTVLAALDLNAASPFTPATGPPLKWWDAFQGSATNASKQIDRVLLIYAPYLDSDVLALVSELQTSEFLVMRLQRLGEHVTMNASEGRPLPFRYAEPSPDHPWGYEHFWGLVSELDKKLTKDETRLRRWGKP